MFGGSGRDERKHLLVVLVGSAPRGAERANRVTESQVAAADEPLAFDEEPASRARNAGSRGGASENACTQNLSSESIALALALALETEDDRQRAEVIDLTAA